MSEVRVFLAGEGPHDIGRWAKDPAYPKGGDVGAVEALLRRCQPDGWRAAAGIKWKDLCKIKIGLDRWGSRGDEHNVAAAALKADEAQCDVLAFMRDRDTCDRKADDGRTDAVKNGIARAAEEHPALAVTGGVAVPSLEGWILALNGTRHTEDMGRHKAAAALDDVCRQTLGKQRADTEAMVDIVRQAQIDSIPDDARSLRDWCDHAKRALGRAAAAQD